MDTRWNRAQACLLAAALAAVALLPPACGSDDGAAPAAGWQTVRSDLTRDTQPDATPAELAALVRGNHELAVALHGALAEGDGNLVLSPLSIRTAFAMVYAGARGETATQMADVLRYTLPEERLHVAFNALDLALASRNDPGDAAKKEDPVELHVANAFWGRRDGRFVPSYLDLLAVHYGAGVETLDFTAPEEAREVINTWVEERTRDRIQDLLPPGSLSAATVAVLTNALYFKAPWALPFDPDRTKDAPFVTLAGATVTVPLMTQIDDHRYAEGAGWRALELAFRLEALAMTFILPDEGTFASFEAALDADALEAILGALSPAEVEVFLPRFEVESEATLRETLSTLGMPVPFSGACDLGGMVEGGGVFIDEAYHKTFLAVDEKGAEAAAATAVVVNETGIPTPDHVFRADRPFLVVIRDVETGAILFLGRITDPTG